MYMPLKSAAPIVVAFSIFLSQNLPIVLRITVTKVMAFAVVQSLSEASLYYEKNVGWKASIKPGENRQKNYYVIDMTTGRQLVIDGSLNVIGLNEPLTGNIQDDFFKQGSALSRLLNRVPAMNATAALHDVWFDKPGGLEFNLINNVITMLPAALISIGAIFGNNTQLGMSDSELEFESYLAEQAFLLQNTS